MSWFNIWGFIFVAAIMVPNIVFAVKCKNGFVNNFSNKYVEIAEQIGRFGCFGFMIINIPGTCYGWINNKFFVLYLITDFILTAAYCAVWAVCFKKPGLFRSLALSILPSILFLASGILTRSVLLIVSAVIFAPCHILISYKNTVK